MQRTKELSLNRLNNFFNSKCFNNVHPNKALLISPLSITSALLLAYYGTEGETRMELMKAFGITKETDEDLQKDLSYLCSNLKSDDADLKLSLIYGLFVRKDFTLYEKYQTIIKQLGTIELVNFLDPNTVNQINKWVSNNTNNLIPELLSPTDI